MTTNKDEARARVREMREEAARKERRREQIIRFGVVAAVLAAVLIVVLAVRSGDDDSGPIATPAGVTEDAGGVPLAGDAAADAPVIEVWYDFNCPHCAAFEQMNGDTLDELAGSGQATVYQRPITFVAPVADSQRAANAWGCAVDEGAGREFSEAVFAAQGSGFSNDNLLQIGESVGLTSDSFRSCVEDGTYDRWVEASLNYARDEAQIQSTPTILLDGQELDSAQWTPEGLVAAVEDAAAGTAEE